MIAAPGNAGTLAKLANVSTLQFTESKLERYAMLQEIAFDHPLFAPLAGPQFGDFTKVHFWKHRQLMPQSLANARVLARFDDGAEAVLEKPIGHGRLIVFTSGWNPIDSQLARSTKFVPLMTGLLEMRFGRRPESTNHPHRRPRARTRCDGRGAHRSQARRLNDCPRRRKPKPSTAPTCQAFTRWRRRPARDRSR